MSVARSILLLGNPNCGKTTLFNALTGDHQRVGNWPGVTVEKKTGSLFIQDNQINLTDLPGIYALVSASNTGSQDAQITANVLADNSFDVLINVIDACHLERHLYLTTQLLELNKPIIIVLNMMDLAKKQGIQIDTKLLSRRLGCPVIMLQANQDMVLEELKQALVCNDALLPLPLELSPVVQKNLTVLEKLLTDHGFPKEQVVYHARRLLEEDPGQWPREYLFDSLEPDADILIADARYQAIHELVLAVQKKPTDKRESFTAKIDKVVLHHFAGIPIFFGMMYVMFFFAVHVGWVFQDFFNIMSDALFVQGSARFLQLLHMPEWLIVLCSNGVGKGISTTLTFIPVMASMFFFLSLLETSGYMTRAAFVVDKAMRALGLPGKAFVPLIVGLGCNVPAILSARIMDSETDRLLTILMIPFMSCSARLAIYTVFVTAFFPSGGQNIVFSLYLIGILAAVITGYLLRHTLFRGQHTALILELQMYHRPSLLRLCKETGIRLRAFLWRAGILIVPICMLFWFLNAWSLDDNTLSMHGANNSLLSVFGKFITPIFAPMGVSQDNWPATVGLLTGMMAKEVVIGSLNTLYIQLGELTHPITHLMSFSESFYSACHSIGDNIMQVLRSILHPLTMNLVEPADTATSSVYGVMAHYFDGQAGAYAYLLFVLLYIPCVSTMATIRQESSRYLMWLSIVWSLILAYVVAVLFYQAATYHAHPLQTLLWCVLLPIIGICGFFIARCKLNYPRRQHVA